jgi:hypothetical protein
MENIGDHTGKDSKLRSKSSKREKETPHKAHCPDCFDFIPEMNTIPNTDPTEHNTNNSW